MDVSGAKLIILTKNPNLKEDKWYILVNLK